jgi:hypothetical protein
MVAELKIKRELMTDLLRRTMHSDEEVREGAVALMVGLLGDKNPHIVASAIEVLIATAAAGDEEAVLSGGGIDCLHQMRDSDDPEVRKKVREALWLLEPEVEETVVMKPQDNY